MANTTPKKLSAPDKSILDAIDKLLQKGYGNEVEMFFAVGKAIDRLMKEEVYNKIAKASQHIAWHMTKRGHQVQFNHGYFYDAHKAIKAVTPAQQKILVKSGMSITKLRYLATRRNAEYIRDIITDIRDGAIKFPYPELKYKKNLTKPREEATTKARGLEQASLHVITVDLTPPIDHERLGDALAAILARLPDRIIDEAVMRAKKVADR